MNRGERRQAKRNQRRTHVGVTAREAADVACGLIGTLGQAADNLEAGLLDPGTQGRADFISYVREMQARLESDPASTLARLGVYFSAPVLARMELALATSEQEPESEAESDAAQDNQSCAAPVRPDKEGA